MNRKQKRAVTLAGVGALLLWAGMARAAGRGKVLVGPVTVTQLPPVSFDKATTAEVQRLSLALTRMRQICGYDLNTLASLQPSAADRAFCEQTIALGTSVHGKTNGLVPLPTTEQQMLALAVKLPGTTLATVNARFYALLGIHPREDNEPTIPLTPAIESQARALITQWRPYSQSAVDALFAQLDLARELGGSA